MSISKESLSAEEFIIKNRFEILKNLKEFNELDDDNRTKIEHLINSQQLNNVTDINSFWTSFISSLKTLFPTNDDPFDTIEPQNIKINHFVSAVTKLNFPNIEIETKKFSEQQKNINKHNETRSIFNTFLRKILPIIQEKEKLEPFDMRDQNQLQTIERAKTVEELYIERHQEKENNKNKIFTFSKENLDENSSRRKAAKKIDSLITEYNDEKSIMFKDGTLKSLDSLKNKIKEIKKQEVKWTDINSSFEKICDELIKVCEDAKQKYNINNKYKTDSNSNI